MKRILTNAELDAYESEIDLIEDNLGHLSPDENPVLFHENLERLKEIARGIENSMELIEAYAHCFKSDE